MSEAETVRLSYAFAKENGVVLLSGGEGATVGFRQGASPSALIEVRRVLGRRFRVEPMAAQTFERALSDVYARDGLDHGRAEEALAGQDDLISLVDGIPQTADLLDDDDAPIIRLINGLLYEAVKRRASDVHIEPYEDKIAIRYRIDGVLQDVVAPSRRLASPLVSRIKVMARLDIAEKRMPQDGRVSVSVGGRSIDVRVATLPSRYGERVTMRLLDSRHAMLALEELGMDSDTFERWRAVLAQPNGIILVTGPTGSGKTTTLYSSLSVLKNGENNILTLEDPIEYGLDGITQTQMNHKVGLTFAATLRAVLRHDPDVVMVGEIRDLETAKVAFEFSSTGRPVLSTVHTNSAVGAIIRLRDMGVEPFLLAANMRAVLAQRLVRKLCENCKAPHDDANAAAGMLGVAADPGTVFYKPVGCLRCANTGYEGRLGVFELMVVDSEVRALIRDQASEDDLIGKAFAAHDTLFQSGRRLAMRGLTSPEEVVRVCRREGEERGGV